MRHGFSWDTLILLRRISLLDSIAPLGLANNAHLNDTYLHGIENSVIYALRCSIT